MQIKTYIDPLNIDDEEYWEEIATFPHLCASQTLKSGVLNRLEIKDKTIESIFTIEEVLNELYSGWLDNPEEDIKRYNVYFKELKKIENERIRQSFIHNRYEVYEAIKMLIELDINPEEIIEDKNLVYREFKKVYIELYHDIGFNKFKKLNINNRKIKKAMVEVKLREGKNNCINLEENSLVIHGVHRFTPMIMRFIRDLKESNINIIFLFNYIPGFEKIYKTWDSVYSWTGLSIELKDRKIIRQNNLGEALALLLDGNISGFNDDKISYYSFSNMTSFTDYVSNYYMAASKEEGIDDSSKRLFKMKEQFYATNINEVSNILKQYHPEQFGDKHFLSYPIGQFILSLYNMWDPAKSELIVEFAHLKECLAIGYFEEGYLSPIEIFNNLEGYLSNYSLGEEYSISSFINNLEIINKNQSNYNKDDNSLYKKISVYNLSKREITYFIEIIETIRDISYELFKNSSEDLDFINHYRNLFDLFLEDREAYRNLELGSYELEMMEEISNRLDKFENKKMMGPIENIKDSLHFYLNKIEEVDKKANESKWIVRGFDQLDGGVMLQDSTKTNRSYHLALVGDVDMQSNIGDILPWPLDEKFFDENIKSKKNNLIGPVMKSLYEYDNYLRFVLFYATYYLEGNIVISYIKEYEDHENSPYFILDILGLKSEQMEDIFTDSLIYKENSNYLDRIIDVNLNIKLDPISNKEARNYLYCPYKYALEDIVGRGTYFTNVFMQRLYYKKVLELESRKRLYLNKLINLKIEEAEKLVQEVNYEIENKLDIRSVFIKKDAINSATKEIYEISNNESDKIIMKDSMNEFKKYYNIRKFFIYGKLTDGEREENLIRELYNNNAVQLAKSDIYYLLSSNIKPKMTDEKIKCKYCGQAEICLEKYR